MWSYFAASISFGVLVFVSAAQEPQGKTPRVRRRDDIPAEKAVDEYAGRDLDTLGGVDPVANNGVKTYNTPDSGSWPSFSDWNALESALSAGASLDGPFIRGQGWKYFWDCSTLGINSYSIAAGGDGVCMQGPTCARDFCDPDADYDLPAYVADVRTPQDIAKALEFANNHNIAVSVKTTGHSLTGASTARNSLLIWMHNYPKNGTIVRDYKNSCDDSITHDAVVAINGGETWNDVLEAVKGEYHMVTGGCRSVSAAGGWLQGCGLSLSSRTYGIGIDQVIDFDCVLANGTFLEKVDPCNEPDLFWALRGGGGGTFGVVTRIHYKLHQVTPVTTLKWSMCGLPCTEQADRFKHRWMDYWLDISPDLDNRWSGSFDPQRCDLTFMGDQDQARESFVNAFDAWHGESTDTSSFSPLPSSTMETFDNWYEFMGGAGAYNQPTIQELTGLIFSGAHEMRARLVPREVVIDRKEELLDTMKKWSKGNPHFINYFLGGKTNEVADNATAVNPAMRNAVFHLTAFDQETGDLIRNFLPNNITGVSFNHHYVLEPNWRRALWGSNYDRLAQLKKKYDPNHVFNCWHCVGYQGEELVQ